MSNERIEQPETRITNFERKISFMTLPELEIIDRMKGRWFPALKFDENDFKAAEIILQHEINTRISKLFENES